jgi:hypothetical protein
MVIRTEYRSQRYSMGSSDPLPAGFEIRFRSLNFQAMVNGYLMRIANHAELHLWRSTGPGPVPTMPAADAPAPAQADVVGPSTPRRRRRSGQRSHQARMERRRAMRAAAQRDAPISEAMATPTGERVTPETRFPHGMRNTATAYASSASTDVAAYEALRCHHLLAARNLIATTNNESYHSPACEVPPDLTWVCGVGLLRRAGPGDVPAVPRRCRLLVRLL